MTLGLFIGSFLRFDWLEKLSYEQLMMLQFLSLILATLNCVYRGPLLIVLLIILIATIISGYLSPKYTTDLVQKIGEEHLTRAESLMGFIFIWLLELGMLVVFMTVGEFMIYKNKRQ